MLVVCLFYPVLSVHRMLATILTLLSHNQDSVAIHINCINPISDLTLENFPFQLTVRVINIWNALPYSVLQCNTVNTSNRQFDFYLKNWGYL